MAHAVGWGPLPMNRKKHGHPVVAGYHGYLGTNADANEVAAMAKQHADKNLAVRMPDGVIGIDVDNYDNKRGDAELKRTLRELGIKSLPPTYSSTARGDENGPGKSRIMFYRLPDEFKGHRWAGNLNTGDSSVEIICWHNRFANVFPSVHRTGNIVRWYGPDGKLCDDDFFPGTDELALLDDTDFIAHIIKDRFDLDKVQKAGLNSSQVQSWLDERPGPDMCDTMKALGLEAAEHFAYGVADHTPAATFSMNMINLAVQGHSGVITALNMAKAPFLINIASKSRSADEWTRLVDGGVQKVVAELEGWGISAPDECPCAIKAELVASGDLKPSEAQERLRKSKVNQKADEFELSYEAQDIAKLRRAARGWAPPEDRGSLAEQYEDPLEPQPFLVDGLVAQNGAVTMIVGQAKVAKTTLAINLVWSILKGEPFVGKFDVAEFSGNVGYWNYELSEQMFNEWCRDVGIDGSASERIHPLPLMGKGVNLEIEAQAKWATEWLSSRDVKVWVIDPLSKAWKTDNDNANALYARWSEAMREIAKNAGVEAIILLAHMGHQDNGRARGTSGIEGDVDSKISLTHDGDAGKPPPNDNRYIEAFGRDVNIASTPLTYDKVTRHMDWNPDGLNKEDARKVGKAEYVHGKIVQKLGGTDNKLKMGDVYSLLGANGSSDGSKAWGAAINYCISQGWLTQEDGPRGAKLVGVAESAPGAESRKISGKAWSDAVKESNKPKPATRRRRTARPKA